MPSCRTNLALAISFLCLTVPIWAHAILLKATPSVNQIVSGPTTSIEFQFNSRVDGKRSKLTLIGPDGHPRALAISEQSSPNSISSQATELTPGSYTVRWQVLAQDGHITRGEVPFKVR
ncbi:MAG: copper resistance protein CopC [Bryobacterales bacterium]|nr:copper resistance protein CopC [Bryobacterales bacterium]MBV9400311.1 copper resistance protein CopC [Bryobacterales bacterium]